MAEQPENEALDDGSGEDLQPLIINAQYTKDLSFEAPTAPGIFAVMQQTPPEVSININVNSARFEDTLYEVVLEIEANCKVGEDVAFILELAYAGLFTLNVPDDSVQPVLLIECPRLLFPFARNIVADVSRDGGFPPVMIGNVDFVTMFQKRVEEMADQLEDAQNAEAEGTED